MDLQNKQYVIDFNIKIEQWIKDGIHKLDFNNSIVMDRLSRQSWVNPFYLKIENNRVVNDLSKSVGLNIFNSIPKEKWDFSNKNFVELLYSIHFCNRLPIEKFPKEFICNFLKSSVLDSSKRLINGFDNTMVQEVGSRYFKHCEVHCSSKTKDKRMSFMYKSNKYIDLIEYLYLNEKYQEMRLPYDLEKELKKNGNSNNFKKIYGRFLLKAELKRKRAAFRDGVAVSNGEEKIGAKNKAKKYNKLLLVNRLLSLTR